MEIKIKDRTILVDECDLPLIDSHTWYIQNDKYVCTHVGDNTKTLQHLILPDVEGYIRHLNGNHFDFTRSNLSIASMAECTKDRKVQTNNKSGITGVSYSKTKSRWIASIRRNGKTISRSFQTYEAAVDWRKD